MSEPSVPEARPPAGRRSATPRRAVSPTLLIGVVLVVLTAAALLTVRPHRPVAPDTAPTSARLDSSSVGCPSGQPRGSAVSVGTGLEGADGEVTVRAGGEASSAPLVAGRVSEVDAEGPVVLTAEGDLAPDLLAARTSLRPLAALDCPAPVPETWFAGVGAGARHDAVLELVNPDGGPAVADVTVHGRGGPLAVPELLGLTVRGHDSLRLRLGELVPRRSELALRVEVSRGRLATSVLDLVPALGARPATEDWLPPQAEPVAEAVHLGLPAGPGTDVLALANPGEDEARVVVRVLTPDSAFTPEGLEEVRVPPGSVRTLTLTTALRAAVRDDAIGITVTSTAPVLSAVRSVVDDDLSHTVPVSPVGSAVTALVPAGAARLVLADAGGVGVADVRAWTADGRELEVPSLELRPGQGGVVELPDGTALVRVTPRRATVHAAVLVTGPGGATVVPLRERVSEALVPAVRPGLP